MALLATALLVTIALSAHQVNSLECLVTDPTINFFGFVDNPEWAFCSYNPTQNTQYFKADGVSNENDEIAVYGAVLDGYKHEGVGYAVTKIPHLCFVEVYLLGRNAQPDPLNRCLCNYDGCNARTEYPWWVTTFGPNNMRLNKTITPAQLHRLRYQESSRGYKFSF